MTLCFIECNLIKYVYTKHGTRSGFICNNCMYYITFHIKIKLGFIFLQQFSVIFCILMLSVEVT